MCGIAGFLELERRSGTHELEALAGAMAAKLAIADRMRAASGPMPKRASRSAIPGFRSSIFRPRARSRWCRPADASCIVYNGEIFNAAELGLSLRREGRRFRGHSDTEVIVEACAEWGVEETASASSACSPFAL